MKILYGYSNCTDKMYNSLFLNANEAVLQPDQKYHGLMIGGFARINKDIEIKCFSGLPINKRIYKKIWVHERDEFENGIKYHYYSTFNLPIIRQIGIFLSAFFSVLREKKNNNPHIICDCLNVANSFGMILAGKVKGYPTVLIVTDLPDMITNSHLTARINNRLFNYADGFLFLTEQMNLKINRRHKPYIVMEGLVDSNAIEYKTQKKYEDVSGKFVFLYAGSIKKIYGIENLLYGFIEANLANCELHIYGDGDFKKELIDIARENPNIIYGGNKSNSEVVIEEMKASILINPRPTNPEYTKYSFPSKNMEYMVSGTPVLTTDLPGMPREYLSYIYLIKDESIKGIANSLQAVYKISREQRRNKGISAKQFVLKNKSNIMQAKNVLDLLRKV